MNEKKLVEVKIGNDTYTIEEGLLDKLKNFLNSPAGKKSGGRFSAGDINKIVKSLDAKSPSPEGKPKMEKVYDLISKVKELADPKEILEKAANEILKILKDLGMLSDELKLEEASVTGGGLEGDFARRGTRDTARARGALPTGGNYLPKSDKELPQEVQARIATLLKMISDGTKNTKQIRNFANELENILKNPPKPKPQPSAKNLGDVDPLEFYGIEEKLQEELNRFKKLAGIIKG